MPSCAPVSARFRSQFVCHELIEAERRQLARQMPRNSASPVVSIAPSIVDNSYVNSNVKSTIVNPRNRTIPIHLDPYTAISQNDDDGWTTISSDQVAEAPADHMLQLQVDPRALLCIGPPVTLPGLQVYVV